MTCHLAHHHGHSALSPLFEATRPLSAVADLEEQRGIDIGRSFQRLPLGKGEPERGVKAGQALFMRTEERCRRLCSVVPEPVALGVEPSSVC